MTTTPRPTVRIEEILGALTRVCRIASVHLPNNEALRATTEQAARRIRDAWDELDERVSLLFVDDTLYASGQVPRLSPEGVAASLDLGELLARFGINELVVLRDVRPDDLMAVAGVFHGRAAPESDTRVLLRRVDPELLAALRDTDATPRERLKQAYATALIASRLLHESLLEPAGTPPGDLRTLVAQVVALAESAPETFAELVAMRPVHHDEGARAVRTMLVALAMGGRLALAANDLAELGACALLLDAARVRAGRRSLPPEARGIRAAPTLDDDGWARLPDATALVVASLAPTRHALRAAAVVRDAVEQLRAWHAPRSRRGALAVIIAVARRFAELVSFDAFTQTALRPDAAVRSLQDDLADARLADFGAVLAQAVGLAPGEDRPRKKVAQVPAPHDDATTDDRRPMGTSAADDAPPRSKAAQVSGERATARGANVIHDDELGLDIIVDAEIDVPLAMDDDDDDEPVRAAPQSPPGSPQGRSSTPAEEEQFRSILSGYFGPDRAASADPSPSRAASVTHELGAGRPAPPPPSRTTLPLEALGLGDDYEPEEPPWNPNTTYPGVPQPDGGPEDRVRPPAFESTARFRLSVDPRTGTLHAEDIDAQGSGRARPNTSAADPGTSALSAADTDPGRDFLESRFTLTGDARRLTQASADSSFGTAAEQRSGEYDVVAVDEQRAAEASVLSANIISRAKTPPKPLPAVGLTPSVEDASDHPTVEVSAGRSQQILSAFGPRPRTLAPSEIRRALAVDPRESSPGEGAQPEAAQARAEAPEPRPVAATEARTAPPAVPDWSDVDGPSRPAAHRTPTRRSGGATIDLSETIDREIDRSALRDRRSADDPGATPLPAPGLGGAVEAALSITGAMPAITGPPEVASEPQRAPGKPVAIDGESETVPLKEIAARVARPAGDTDPGRPRPYSTQDRPAATARPAAPRTEAPAEDSRLGQSQAPGASPAHVASEQPWSVAQTVDVGSVKARRFLEAFARETWQQSASASHPGVPATASPPPPPPQSAPARSASTTGPTAAAQAPPPPAHGTQPLAPFAPARDAWEHPPAASSASVSSLGTSQLPVEDDGTPGVWKRSRKVVRRLRNQRATGGRPVARGALSGDYRSVEELLRDYLEDDE